MIDLEKLHEELKDMSIPNSEMIAWITLLSNELRAAREVVKTAREESKSYCPSEPMSCALDRYMDVTKWQ